MRHLGRVVLDIQRAAARLRHHEFAWAVDEQTYLGLSLELTQLRREQDLPLIFSRKEGTLMVCGVPLVVA